MADSDWTTITEDESDRLETEFTANDQHNVDPVGTVSYTPGIPTYDPPAPAEFPPQQGPVPSGWDTTRTDTFSLLFKTGVGPSEPVQQYCDRCSGDHTHTLVNSSLVPLGIPALAPYHVEPYHYGHRDGDLYRSCRVTGALLKRTVDIRKYQHDAAPELEVTPVTWQRKAVDHVEQGPFIRWLTGMRAKDCFTQLSKLVFRKELVEVELLAMLHQAGATSSLLDDGGGIAELVAAAEELEDPRVSVDASDSGDVEVTLLDRGEDGDLREAGAAKIRRHDGGFTTLVDWKPKARG